MMAVESGLVEGSSPCRLCRLFERGDSRPIWWPMTVDGIQFKESSPRKSGRGDKEDCDKRVDVEKIDVRSSCGIYP